MAHHQSQRPEGLLDFAVIGDAFNLLFKRWSDYLLMGFICCILPVLVIIGYAIFIFAAVSASPGSFESTTMIGVQMLMYPIIFGSMFVAAPCYGGVIVYTLKVVRTGEANINDFWGEWSKAGRWYALLLIYALWYLLGVLACGIGSLVVAAFLFLAMPIMAHENLSPSDAIRESYERLKSQFWMALGLSLVTGVLASLGQLACYIGYIFTFPLYLMIPAMAYARWLARAEPPASASPYPRSGYHGYGEQPQHIGEGTPAPPRPDEKPRPPVDEHSSQPQGDTPDARRIAEEELRRDTSTLDQDSD